MELIKTQAVVDDTSAGTRDYARNVENKSGSELDANSEWVLGFNRVCSMIKIVGFL